MPTEFDTEIYKTIIRSLVGKTGLVESPKRRRMHLHPAIGKPDTGENPTILIKKNDKQGKSLDNLYYSPMLLKSLDFVQAFNEVVASYLVSLASVSAGELDYVAKVHFSELFPGSDIDEAIVVTRLYKNFIPVNKIESSELRNIDAGAALAKTFWIGDFDAHGNNLGVIYGTNKAIRIDFNWAFDKMNGNIEFIIQRSTMHQGSFKLFAETLSSRSFCDELERLSSMEYYNSYQFEHLINTIFTVYEKHYEEHREMDLDKKTLTHQIQTSLRCNSIEMKFIAEVVKINIVLKQPGKLRCEDILKVKKSLNQLKSFMATYPEFAEQAMENVATIFGVVTESRSKSNKHNRLIDYLEKTDPEMWYIFIKGVNRGEILCKGRKPDIASFREIVGIIYKENVEYFKDIIGGFLVEGWGDKSILLNWRRYLSEKEIIGVNIERDGIILNYASEIRNLLILNPYILASCSDEEFIKMLKEITPAGERDVFPGEETLTEINEILQEIIDERTIRLLEKNFSVDTNASSRVEMVDESLEGAAYSLASSPSIDALMAFYGDISDTDLNPSMFNSPFFEPRSLPLIAGGAEARLRTPLAYTEEPSRRFSQNSANAGCGDPHRF